MDLTALYSALLPTILTAIGAVLSYVLARAAAVAQARWGIEIEATHREALHSALMTGIQAALTRGMTGPAAVQAALDYVAHSVPDALAALDPSHDVLTSLATAKLAAASGPAGTG